MLNISNSPREKVRKKSIACGLGGFKNIYKNSIVWIFSALAQCNQYRNTRMAIKGKKNWHCKSSQCNNMDTGTGIFNSEYLSFIPMVSLAQNASGPPTACWGKWGYAKRLFQRVLWTQSCGAAPFLSLQSHFNLLASLRKIPHYCESSLATINVKQFPLVLC